MSVTHIVSQGEHIAWIAENYGFHNWSPIWNHSDNDALRAKRPNPHVLYPGDRVFIPERENKSHDCISSKRHRFRTSVDGLLLRIVLLDVNRTPVPDTEADLLVGMVQVLLRTDANGEIKREIPATADHARLRFWNTDLPVKIGYLDPVEEVSGQVARLNNLGYDAGSLLELDPDQLTSAIEEFQCDFKLTVNGVCGAETQARLQMAHGC